MTNIPIYEELSQKGVVTKLHIGRARCTAKIKAVKGEESHEFVKLGRIQFLPMSLEKHLSYLEGAIRQHRLRLSLNDNFMLLEDFRSFKQTFDEQKRKYFEARDEIIERWDEIVGAYKKNLSKVESLEIECIHIPSKASYARSFYFDLEIGLLPTIDLSNVKESFQEVRAELLVSNQIGQELFLSQIQGKMISEIVEMISTMSSQEDRLNGKTRKHVEGRMERIRERNFSEAVTDALEWLSKTLRSETRDETGELALTTIFGLCRQKKLQNFVDWNKSFIDRDHLEEMAELLMP